VTWPNPIWNAEHRLRNGWWVLAFFVVLASGLFPFLLSAKQAETAVSPGVQAAVVLVASLVCQGLRRRPIGELTGRLDRRWPRELFMGFLAGAILMLLPALALAALGILTWTVNAASLATLPGAFAVLAGAVIAEELVFRGFVFQRLIDGLGPWPAQLILAAYFVLTHATGLAAAGELRPLASVNIFLASLLFGLAYLRTRSLALPLGLHFAANVTQGPLLGLGVSGDLQPGLLTPHLTAAPAWLTGGAFGLEASVPGLIAVIVATILLARWRAGRSYGENVDHADVAPSSKPSLNGRPVDGGATEPPSSSRR
jgi:membrane protease YdiL (CAAX protease family)